MATNESSHLAGWRATCPEEQCDHVERHGTEGFLCCGLRDGHLDAGVSHTNCYGSSHGPWMTRAEWERDHGEAARNCYLPRKGGA